ncbi:MAG: CHAD domain-containing protein [Candidatus Poriferisodalaceae bacterium]|jgi:CHAD domain-containing protein
MDASDFHTVSDVGVSGSGPPPDSTDVTQWDTADLRLRHRNISLTRSSAGRWRLQLPAQRGMVNAPDLESPASTHPPAELLEILWPISMGAPLMAVGTALPSPALLTPAPQALAKQQRATPATAQDLFDLSLGTEIDQLHIALPWIRAAHGDQQSIRQSRVAVRRARTLLRAYRPYFVERPLELEARLGVLNNHLRAVRDVDSINSTVDQLSSTIGRDLSPLALAALRQTLTRERRVTLGDLDAEVVHLRTAHLLNDLGEPPVVRLVDGDVAPEITARQIIQRAVRSSRQQAKRTRAEFDDPSARLDSHLRLRTLVRRLRVISSAAIPVIGDDASRLARRAAGVQQQLGDIADLAKTVRWLSNGDVGTAETRAALSAHAVGLINGVTGAWQTPWGRVVDAAEAKSLSAGILPESTDDPRSAGQAGVARSPAIRARPESPPH